MIKKTIYILLFLSITACSVDTKTGIWENNKDPLAKKSLTMITFSENLSYKEYKENIILYGKKSKFPNLDDQK